VKPRRSGRLSPAGTRAGPEQASRDREKGLTCSAAGHTVCQPAAGTEAAWKSCRGLDGPRLLLYSPLAPLPFLALCRAAKNRPWHTGGGQV
jgi:hypothetical protein